MKRYICFTLLSSMLFLSQIKAQAPRLIVENDSISKASGKKPSVGTEKKDSIQTPDMYGWYVDPRSGERTMVETDQTLYDFHQSTLVDGQGIAMGYLGNLGSPAQSKLFFEREDPSLFPFLEPFSPYYQTPEKRVFINTKIPYSNIHYQTAGGKQNSEERFKTILTSNFGKKINAGFDIDYIYSRGYYTNLSNKQISYNFFGSYISERYQMHAYIANNQYNNSENGGISDMRYITDPTASGLEALGNNPDSKAIPVRISSMWNRLKGRQIFVSNKYNVGYEKMDEDSIVTDFIPVASFILTTRYSDQQRRFASEDATVVNAGTNSTATDTLYSNNYYAQNGRLNTPANDQMSYWSFKNTFAISLNEGFKEWVKFGLMAYIEQDFRKFLIPSSAFSYPLQSEIESQNSTIIGGRLTKEKGRLLRYNLDAQFGVLGANLGEIKLEGDISSSIRIAGKDAVVKAKAYMKNLTPTFFQERYQTKYFKWDNNLDDTRRVFVGGEIIIPHTQTRLSGGVENIQNYIYYGSDKFIAQESDNIQVMSFRIDQKLRAGIFHWDNQVAYQKSTNESAIPVPALSLYSNLYLLSKVGKVLTIQLGADMHFHTKYYAPGYEPAILQFYNQRDVKIGGFPIASAYANINLKKSRFFVMMYNVAEGFGDSEYFTLPNYPVNPMIFKMGISWDFSN